MVLRERYHHVIWRLLLPIRWYIRHFPIRRGRGIVLRQVLLRALPPPPATLKIPLPLQTTLAVGYRDSIGLSTLMEGLFEAPEIDYLLNVTPGGACMIDIGANVGLFTIPLAKQVGSRGKVLAFEPVHKNLAQLEENVRANDLKNVRVFATALGSASGEEIEMSIPDDGAFASTKPALQQRGACRIVRVPVETVDTIWSNEGFPMVGTMKIDVEGAELEVLKGSQHLLGACRPIILIEANTAEHFAKLRRFLEPLGYRAEQPPQFSAWNYVFLPQRTSLR